MKRLSKTAARRLAIGILALPVIAFAVFLGWMRHIDKVYIPNSAEYKRAEEFLHTNGAIKKEFGDLIVVRRDDRWELERVGEQRQGFFSFAIDGSRDHGVLDVYWSKPNPDAVVDITEVRRSDPWKQSRVLFSNK